MKGATKRWAEEDGGADLGQRANQTTPLWARLEAYVRWERTCLARGVSGQELGWLEEEGRRRRVRRED